MCNIPLFFVALFQMFTSVRVFRLSNANLTNQGLNKIFTDLCENLLKVKYRCNILKKHSFRSCMADERELCTICRRMDCSCVLKLFGSYKPVMHCLLQSLYFKLRSMIPCCLCHLNFTVAVPEEELIQVTVIMNTVSLYLWLWNYVANIVNKSSNNTSCGFPYFLPLSAVSFCASQVAVTAVAMTFDKDQSQEKPGDRAMTKGMALALWL